jgi:predicted TIM-barrel fold metal-dependent hydrolase
MSADSPSGRPVVEDLVAIDVHTHVNASVRGGTVAPDSAEAALLDYFHVESMPTLPEMIEYYRERKIAFVAFTVDALTVTGDEPAASNEEIAQLAAEAPDVVIPFASVDPGRGAAAVRIARRLIEEHHVRGFKFHPSLQAFYPNDRSVYPLYELLAEHGLPALFHTGQTGVGAGQRGGGGVRLKYSNPLYLDDVAVDIPDMPIIMAHPSVPWQDEALSVAVHKPQVYIDLSGWSPKYFPPQLVKYANTLLKDKVLFGSDFPALTPDRWLADFDKLEIKPEVRPKILKDTAARLLGFTPAATTSR